MAIDLSRRGFLGGAIASVVAAPAIVRAASLMPVRGLVMDIDQGYARMARTMSDNLYGDLVDITRKAFLPRLFVQLYSASDIGRMVQLAAAGA